VSPQPIYLVVIGFCVGVMGGFCGVGGSFIAGPALRAAASDGISAVGTDLPHIVGNPSLPPSDTVPLAMWICVSIYHGDGRWAARKSERSDPMLKRAGNVNFVVSVVSIATT